MKNLRGRPGITFLESSETKISKNEHFSTLLSKNGIPGRTREVYRLFHFWRERRNYVIKQFYNVFELQSIIELFELFELCQTQCLNCLSILLSFESSYPEDMESHVSHNFYNILLHLFSFQTHNLKKNEFKT
jgi:hypothetical protein